MRLLFSKEYFFNLSDKEGQDVVWVVFEPFRTWSKIQKFKSFYGCYIQVSVHLSLYFGEVSTYVREEIFLHELRPFGDPDIIWVVLPFLY